MVQGEECRYHAVAKESDCKILKRDSQTLKVPRAIGQASVHGGMGRYVWYAEGQRDYLERLAEFIASHDNAAEKPSTDSHLARQFDQLLKTKVEEAASATIERYYEDCLGYKVEDVSKEKYGWDLSAKKDDVELYLEVKGLSGINISVELTANEYKQMKKYRDNYRVCIVADALSANPPFSIYSYNPVSERWEDDTSIPINVKEVTGARLYI